MTEKYFNSLNIDQRAEIAFQKAKFIGTRIYYNQKIILYSFENLFIEVWYGPNENKIYKIELLQNLQTIDIYIEQNKYLNV